MDSKPNLPDEIQTRSMEEQRILMLRYATDARLLLNGLQEKIGGDTGLQEDAILESVKRYKRDVDALENMEFVQTLWCDPERTNDTAYGGSGCWGDNITDVRLQSRRFKKDKYGNKLTGSETDWQFCQMLQVGSNVKDTRTVIDASSFFMITSDDDGSNKRRKSLDEITGNLKRYFPSEGLEAPRARVGRVAVSHRMAFVPVPSDAETWAVEVRYVCFGYNTMVETEPKNLLLYGDTMNTSIFSEKPGWKVGYQPLYNNVRTSINGSGEEQKETKMRSYSTSVEATDRTIKNVGTETAEESAAAAAAGKGTQVRTGPATLKGTSSCAWHVAIPLEVPNQHTTRGTLVVDANNDDLPMYRSLCASDEDIVASNDCVSESDRVDKGMPLKSALAKEARIGIGTWIQDAEQISVKNPVAKSSPAVATAVYIMTIPAGTVPSFESVVDASLMLKERHAHSNEIGTEINDRMSSAAVEAGLTTVSPLSKKAKLDIEKAKNTSIFAPGTVDAPPEIATGRPCFTGMPIG